MTEELEIIIVDDDEGHRLLVSKNLRRAGVKNPIISLDNGQALLDLLHRQESTELSPPEPYLVLLDINMPGLDGTQVLARLKENPATKKLPVIMLTTTEDPREVERCYELGCSVYITKPVDPWAFTDAIRKLGLFISVIRVPGEEPHRAV